MEKEENREQQQEFKGRNLEDAISLAEHVLKLPRSKFNYEIVTEKTKLFGIKAKEVVIRAWEKTAADKPVVLKFLDDLIGKLPLEIRYYTQNKNEMLYIIFEGPDKSLLIRKEGALLLAIQHLLNKVSAQKVQTDCDFYRKRKEQALKDQAQKIARRVYESGKKETLDYMNPYERRIVHIAVNQIPGITSKSLGDGFLKKMNIFPVKEERTKESTS
ncbi:MAG: Jag N-terminal domain-containing protein [Candidatus Aminicenantes bacterium]|jgi:spoIIIJ-associated protein